MKSLKITIPKPCSENWQKMEKREQSRYCSACQRCVIDFTNFSENELMSYLNSTNEKVCGHFNQSQLNKLLINRGLHESKGFNFFSTLMLISTVSFSNNIKESLKYPLTLVQESKDSKDDNKSFNKKSLKKDFITISIKGKVYDCETKENLQYASVSIKGTQIGTVTNDKGEFELLIPSEYNNSKTVLLVSIVGYFTKEYDLSGINKENWEIGLSGETLTGEVVIIRKQSIWNKFSGIFKRKDKKTKCE